MDRINLRTEIPLQSVLGISRGREKPHILIFCLFCGGTFVAFSYEIKDSEREKKEKSNEKLNKSRVSQ